MPVREPVWCVAEGRAGLAVERRVSAPVRRPGLLLVLVLARPFAEDCAGLRSRECAAGRLK